MKELLGQINECRLCESTLPLGPKPVLQAHQESKIVIIGQAPGSVVHASGIPWKDKSGDNLRNWLSIDEHIFYDERKIALIPMGFCFPGTGKTGDLPPRKECAPLWHHQLFNQMEYVRLTLLIGSYAQKYYLPDTPHRSLTARVAHFEEFLPRYFVLPHPSPRNNIWQKKNEWFKLNVLPELKNQVQLILKSDY